MSKPKCAFIGLGVMGYPIAGHLVKNGFNITVYHKDITKAQIWSNTFGGHFALSAKEAVKYADIVILCLESDQEINQICYGSEEILTELKTGAILVDHTTTSATFSITLANKCQNLQIHFMDAPLSGGYNEAQQGSLTIMCGGESSIFSRLQNLFLCYSQHALLVGSYGQGQYCKMFNQICLAGILQGLSEAILFAKKKQLNIEHIIPLLKQGNAGSWQMTNRAITMAKEQFDFGFAVDEMIRDLIICLEEADAQEVHLPSTKSILKRYVELSQMGYGLFDTSTLIKIPQKKKKLSKLYLNFFEPVLNKK